MVFTGLVQCTGEAHWPAWPEQHQLVVRAALVPVAFPEPRVGDSIAVDGVCLTVVRVHVLEEERVVDLTFDVHPETLRVTALAWQAQWQCNLELAATLSSAVGGHLVQGHVHARGHLVSATPVTTGEDWIVQVPWPLPEGLRLVHKGSIALNGVSLTVAEIFPADSDTDTARKIRIALLPHTLKSTNLASAALRGAPFNIEFEAAAAAVAPVPRDPRAADESGMTAALAAAQKAAFCAPPEPPVGVAVVDTVSGRVLATAATTPKGKEHAEARVLRLFREFLVHDLVDLEACDSVTMYVTMEPCHDEHPESGGPEVPCAQTILQFAAETSHPRLSRVVYAVSDPDPRERGQGAQFLRNGGMVCDQLVPGSGARSEAEILYMAHGHHRRTGRPWLILERAGSDMSLLPGVYYKKDTSATYGDPDVYAWVEVRVDYTGPGLWKTLGRQGVTEATWVVDALPVSPLDVACVCEVDIGLLPEAGVAHPWSSALLVMSPRSSEHRIVYIPPADPDAPLVPASAEAAREAIAAGHLVVVADDEDRENECDLVGDARRLDVDDMAFFIRHTSGLVCAVVTATRALELGLAPQRPPTHWTAGQDVHAKLAPQFTVTVDHVDTKTGVSADERLLTLLALADPDVTSVSAFRAGAGHVLPLVARQGGLAERRGHTEATMALLGPASMPASGRAVHPVGVLAELRSADGRGMMRRDEAQRFAREHGLLFTTVDVLSRAQGITSRELVTAVSPVIVRELSRAPLTLNLAGGTSEGWQVALFADSAGATEAAPHRVLFLNRPEPATETWCVRIHSDCWWGDALGSAACDCGAQLQDAIVRIHQLGRGAIVFPAHHEGRGIGIVHKAKAYAAAAAQGLDTFEANRAVGRPDDARNYDAVRPVLESLHLPGLGGRGTVLLWTRNPAKAEALGDWLAGTTPLDVAATPQNAQYLATKHKAWQLQPTGIPTMNLGSK